MSDSIELVVESKTPPKIIWDHEAGALYLRFRSTKVRKTINVPAKGIHIAVDLDKNGRVIGIEAIGATDYSFKSLLKKAKVSAPNVDWSESKLSLAA